MELDRLLSVAEVIGLMGVSKSTFWRLVRSGKFPKPIDISAGRVGVPSSMYEEWLAAKRRH